MNDKKSVAPPRELQAVMTLREFLSFCRTDHKGRYPAFAVRTNSSSQKWTIYVFKHVGGQPMIREVWTGSASIPDVKETVRKVLFDMGFSAISKLIQGGNGISCFVMPTNPNLKTIERSGLNAPRRRTGVILYGMRGLTEYGGQTHSPGPEMVEMLVGQYDWHPKQRALTVLESCKLTGPACMAFIGELLAKFGTPVASDD